MPNDTTPAPIGADALREALWICVEHNALHFGETHNTVVQGRAALAGAAPAAQGDAEDAAHYRWLRDYFAAQALAGGLEQGHRDDMDCGWWHDAGVIANRAYAIADAMLKAQRKK